MIAMDFMSDFLIDQLKINYKTYIMRFIILFVILLTGCFTQAQTPENPGTPEERAEKLTLRMQEELVLTTEQVPPVKALNLKYAKIMQTEVVDRELSMWTMYNKGTKINKEKEKELKPLLTETQWKKYEMMRSKAMSQIWSRIF